MVGDPRGDELRRAAARNLAAWHHASVLALGLRPRWGERFWTCPLPGPTIYHSAVAIEPAADDPDAHLGELGTHLADPGAAFVSVGDPFGDLPLDRCGLRVRGAGPWLARPPGPAVAPPSAPPTEPALAIERVADPDTLAGFEQAMAVSFGTPFAIGRFDVHAPGILDDPAMHVFVGRIDGRIAGVAMAYVTDVVGVYGVGTRPEARRRGVATALTLAAVSVDPDRTTVLQPSPAAEPLYARLGFAEVARHRHWH